MFAQKFRMFLQCRFQGEKQDAAVQELAVENLTRYKSLIQKNQAPGRTSKGSPTQELRIPLTRLGNRKVRFERQVFDGRESPEFVGTDWIRFGLELLPGIGLQSGEPIGR